MAFTFVVEIGEADPDATSYCDVEFADDYTEANTFQSSDWLALDEEDKQRLLVRASRMLDVRFKWHGQRVDQDSGLKWPRAGVFDEDGFVISDTVIPVILKQATAEFAVYLMQDDWTSPRDADQFKRLQVDVIDVQYNTDFRRAYIPPTLVEMLSALGSSSSGNRPGFKKIIRA
jgi:hypothetical protein